MIKFYDILKAMHLNYSDDYFTQAITHRNIKPLYTVSGTLPITLPTKPRYHSFDDWEIFGNADGVGERTKNLFSSAAAETKTDGNLSVTSDGNGNYTINKTGALSSDTTIIFNIAEMTIPVSKDAGGNGILAFFNNAFPTGTRLYLYYNGEQITYINITTENRVLTNYSTPANKTIDAIGVRFSATEDASVLTGVLSPMLTTDGITPSTFIPYGYKIPLTVSQTGQTDKNYDIFIGDTPLGEGETVSQNTSETRITVEPDLETTISTTLENKPEMKIIYN